MGQIMFKAHDKKAALRKGRTILSYIQGLGISINAFCGGRGECKGCLIKVDKTENLSAMADVERRFIKVPGYRLACQARVLKEDEDIYVEIPKYNILEKAVSKKIPINPFVKKEHIFHPLWQKIYWKNRRLGEYEGELYGVALDVGTSTLLMYWVDLETGNVSFVYPMLNPQSRYGDNIISRISYARTKGQRDLERAVRESVNGAIQQGPIDPNHIYEMTVVGNSVMRDLFIGHSVEGLGEAPFKPLSEAAVNKMAKDLEITINPRANVYALPLIGHFVGADALGVILTTEMYENPAITMAIDIGTNTEIAIGNEDKIIVTSCASGPAFEGSGLKCGMGAVEGTVQKVEISEDLKVKYETIGNVPPIGICGSGLIDALAQMLDRRIIDWRGKFSKGEKEFVIAENGARIFLDGEDIDNLKLAKSAISVGTKVVMDHYGVDVKDIEKLYIAGAFGNYINLENAFKIGMFSNIPPKKIFKVGNAAIEGARQVLISQEKRKEAEEISKKIKHVRLEMEEDFQYKFVRELGFNKYKS